MSASPPQSPADPETLMTLEAAGQYLGRFLEWIAACKARDPRALNYVGKRAIVAAWFVNPASFDNTSPHEMQSIFRIPEVEFKAITAEFSRKFKVKNQFQAHDWQNRRNPPRRSNPKPNLQNETT